MSRVEAMRLARPGSAILEATSRPKSGESGFGGSAGKPEVVNDQSASSSSMGVGKGSRDTSVFLTTWYKLDENCTPPAYVLQTVRFVKTKNYISLVVCYRLLLLNFSSTGVIKLA